MKIDGACHCGDITYEAEIDPAKVAICHCTDCQTLSGSAFRTVAMTEVDRFRLLSGKPTIYVKVAESGAERQQAFCARCGSPLYATSNADGPKIYGLRAGTIRQRDQLVPQLQVWTRSAQHWLGEIDTIRKVEKQAQPARQPEAD